jgi:TIR domain
VAQPKVFISYRRDEPGDYAGHIYRALRDTFGADSIFIDVVTLGPGTNWAEEITTTVGESRALLVVIGPSWARLAKSGTKEQDFVELEVQLALQRPDTTVIPVLVGGATMPDASELPPSLMKLAERHALTLHNQYWDHGIEELRKALERCGLRRLAPPPPPRPPQGETQPEDEPTVVSGSPSVGMLVLQGVVLAFVAGLVANWLVARAMPAPDEFDNPDTAAAIGVARRTAQWAMVGAVLALWLALANRGGRSPVGRAIAGLLLGAIAGAIGGTVDALPAFTDQEFDDWLQTAALAATGGLIGALLGGSWEPPHSMYGLVAGAGAGALAELIVANVDKTGQAALRVAIIAGLVLGALAALTAAREAGPARAHLPPPRAH